jgi:hypothetical protein
MILMRFLRSCAEHNSLKNGKTFGSAFLKIIHTIFTRRSKE